MIWKARKLQNLAKVKLVDVLNWKFRLNPNPVKTSASLDWNNLVYKG